VKLAARLALMLLLAAAAAVAGTSPVRANDPWIAEAPPVAGVAALYMEIRNATDRPVRLTGAISPRFRKIEMHESTVRDGMASMRRLDGIDIGAGESVSFAPGGRHFMLFGEAPLPRAGESVPISLQFADGTALELSVPVRQGSDVAHESAR
jgi:copper(I)-binding protein